MPLYECMKCHVIENTAIGGYWEQQLDAHEKSRPFQPLCSLCYSGQWHGQFDRTPAAGMLIDQRGFLWRGDEQLPPGHKIVGAVESMRDPAAH